MYNVIVVGAGFAGSVLARKMADSGMKVLVIDKRSHIGGNMYEEYGVNNIPIHRYGPHIFHTNSEKVFGYLKSYSDWYEYKHRVLSKIDGKLVPVPFNFTSIDILFDDRDAEMLKSELQAHFPADSRVSVFDLIKHPKEKVQELGNFICEKVFFNYTAKQWGISIDEIDKATINRVPVVIGYDDGYFQDSIQMMPSGGFTLLMEKMLSHKNIEIRLNVDAKKALSLDFDTNEIIFNKSKFKGIVFYTGAIDELMDYQFGVLPYRSLNLAFENIECEYYQTNSVVNYPNDELFTRITEFKYFFPFGDITDSTVILKEYPIEFVPDGKHEPYYPVITDNSSKIYSKYVDRLKKFDNLYLCGRLAEYKYYNMDAVVLSALNLAEEILNRPPQKAKPDVIRQIFWYGVIGSFSAGLDSLIFYFLRSLDWNLYAANFIGINLGIMCSFSLNALFNFKMTDKLLKRAAGFLSVGYFGLLLSTLIIYFGVDVMKLRDITVKIFSVFIVAGFQFVLNKFITFRRKTNE
jgi:UDP-galactopyranose mutase